MVIQPQFEPALAFPFSEGLAAVGKGSAEDARYGFMDKTGTVVIPMQYELAPSPTWRFSEGLCKVMVREAGEQRWGFIDKTGAMVIKAQFAGVSDFSEGLATADYSNSDLHGFIDKTGKWVIELPPNLQLYGLRGDNGFSEGLAIVQEFVPGDAEHPVHVGYIDQTGKVVIQPQFVAAFSFSEGLAAAEVSENGALKWGYIDKTGAWVIRPQFDAASFFSEGLAAVATGSGDSTRRRFIDKTGKVAIALLQNQVPVGLFSGGVVGVRDSTANGTGLAEYIDTTGKVIWQAK
jgi:WG containing repeat